LVGESSPTVKLKQGGLTAQSQLYMKITVFFGSSERLDPNSLHGSLVAPALHLQTCFTAIFILELLKLAMLYQNFTLKLQLRLNLFLDGVE